MEPTSNLPDSATPGTDEDAFARLFIQHQRMLFGYLVTSLGSTTDAEEVLQETFVILWRERKRFQPGTSFIKWATVIAHNQVRKFRRQRERRPFLPADEILDQIAAASVERSEIDESRRRALRHCLERLEANDRVLVREAYSHSLTKKEVAQLLDRPVNTVYKALHRIRMALLSCIEKRLKAEGFA